MNMKGKLVSDFLEWSAKNYPTKHAIIQGDKKISYGELNSLSNQVANWLQGKGVQHQDRIVLIGSNDYRVIISIFGVLKVGAIFVLLNPQESTNKLNYIIDNCSPSVLIIDWNIIDKLQHEGRLIFSNPILVFSGGDSAEMQDNLSFWDELSKYSEGYITKNVDDEDLAAIIYTSGSTDLPKGVMERHRQIVFATSAINKVIGNHFKDIILCGLPLSFDYGLYQVFLTFQVGATLLLEKDFSFPLAIPRILKENKVTGFPGVPSLFSLLIRSKLLERIDLPNLRYITSTGDVFPSSHIKRIKKILPDTTVFPMYGLTECKRVSIMPKGKLNGFEDSVGLPLPGTRVSIVDSDGCLLQPGEVGELVVSGPHVMAGYWEDINETEKRFRQDSATGNRVLFTGDLFTIGQNGFLYFVGRSEQFIKSRGHKISPAEIENFLCEIDGVAEAAVVGVEDPTLGEAIFAIVSLNKPGILSQSGIISLCKKNLKPAICPSYVEILHSTLPKTKNGKLNRKKLREIATKILK